MFGAILAAAVNASLVAAVIVAILKLNADLEIKVLAGALGLGGYVMYREIHDSQELLHQLLIQVRGVVASSELLRSGDYDSAVWGRVAEEMEQESLGRQITEDSPTHRLNYLLVSSLYFGLIAVAAIVLWHVWPSG